MKINSEKKTAALLLSLSILFPLFHQETENVVLNGGKSAFKAVLKMRGLSGNAGLRLLKKSSKTIDLECHACCQYAAVSHSARQGLTAISLQLIPESSQHYYLSRATFS